MQMKSSYMAIVGEDGKGISLKTMNSNDVVHFGFEHIYILALSW